MIFYLSIFDFAGRMHPVLVHLPIGILMLVCLYFIFVKIEKRQEQRHFISAALFWGMLSAVGACVSGLALANSGDYEASAVANHQWMGIATAVVSIVCYFIHKQQWLYTKWAMLLLFIFITIAGHLGGSITHGEDYLTAPFTSDGAQGGKTVFKPMPNVQEAFVYNDIIKPILSSKCYSCHGTSKQKGKLRLDEPDFILKGGKDGPAIAWDHADESKLIKLILLPETDEDHMPPKEKPQLTKVEMDLLQWWVNSGARFDKKVSQSKQTDKIKPTLLALQNGSMKEEGKVNIIPEKEVSAADAKAIVALKEKGAVVIPVAANSNYLLVNFVGADKVGLEELKLLEPLKDQLLWLKVANENLSDKDMEPIGKLTALMRLHVEGNPITDVGLQHFKNLSNLQYINLSGTKITQQGLLGLKGLKKLEKIYLYKVGTATFDKQLLKKTMPKTLIDTGGYIVPTLEGDTTIYKVEAAPM
ncbi:c-type cytochrome domain-containing protein [Niabella ginsengisoli]|uniref:Cytochrome c domain-containing protein n=1 Tax=Niabella ginsengisoli TaxID=522298 RepID=A0ABS9SLJ7_9BACT|nr:c-type cytochrome domain-containing protein [Niabella ginsengisoli]MCH5599251.1 hypothetical protein [Niabella ginsengisoli]